MSRRVKRDKISTNTTGLKQLLRRHPQSWALLAATQMQPRSRPFIDILNSRTYKINKWLVRLHLPYTVQFVLRSLLCRLSIWTEVVLSVKEKHLLNCLVPCSRAHSWLGKLTRMSRRVKRDKSSKHTTGLIRLLRSHPQSWALLVATQMQTRSRPFIEILNSRSYKITN